MFLRKRVRAVGVVAPAWLFSVCAVVACERPNPFRTGDTAIQYNPQAGPINGGSRLPLVSCVDSFSSKRELSLRARLAPDEALETDDSGEPGWVPVEIADVAALDSGFVVLDRGAAEVALVSKDLEVVRTWGRRGGGPGEFQAPAAITVDPSGDTIWVLDAAPPRLIGFDKFGRLQRDFRVPALGIDVARDADGTFYIAQRPMLVKSGDGMEPLPLVSVFGPNGELQRTLRSTLTGGTDDPRLNLPGFVEPQLSSRGNRVAVSYPASGIVDVYDSGELVQTIQLCMPPDLKAAYDQQLRDATVNTNSQTSVIMISDVHLAREGDVSVLSLIKTPDGFLHVDQTSADGRSLGSIGLTSAAPVPVRARFGVAPDRFLSISGTGELSLYGFD